MKKTDFAEIKKLDRATIIARVKKTRSEISDLILDKNTNKLKDQKAISKKKRDLAQVLTVLRQLELLKELESKNMTKEVKETK